MHQAIEPEIDRTITAAEVTKWFGHGHKPWPSEDLCAQVADRLNKMRWPIDPQLPKIGDDEWWVRDTPSPDDPNPQWRREPYKADPWWDSQESAARAKALLDDIPAMLSHWQRMRRTRFETRPGQKPMRLRGGYAAIERLRVALDAAVPYLEFPVGEYERQNYRKRKRPSPWHVHAVVITPIIAAALRQSGHAVPGTTHNSAVVRIVREALVRMGYTKKITPAAIAARLTGWYAEHGRSF